MSRVVRLPPVFIEALDAYRRARLDTIDRLARRRIRPRFGGGFELEPRRPEGEATAAAHLHAKLIEAWDGNRYAAGIAYRKVVDATRAATNARLGRSARRRDDGKWPPEFQAADLELQLIGLVAAIEHAKVAIDADVRDWSTAAWRDAGLPMG